MKTTYCIVENFRGRELSQVGGYVEKTFTDCSAVLPMDATPTNFREKTFANSHKPSKFVKNFLPVPTVQHSILAMNIKISYVNNTR